MYNDISNHAAGPDSKSSQSRTPQGLARFFQSVLVSGAGSSASIIFLFLETLIAVRLVSADDYGAYVLLIAVASFFVMAVDCGSKTAVTQLMAGQEQTRQVETAATALLFRFFAIGVVSGLLWLGLGKPLVALFDPSLGLLPYSAWIPLLLLAMSVDELLAGMLQGTQSYRQMALAQILRSVLRLGLTTVLLVWFDFGLWALVYSWVFSFAASAVYQLWVLPLPKQLSWSKATLDELLRFGFPLQMSRFLWFLFNQVDIFLLGLLAGPASVAYYAVASKIPSALQQLVQAYIAVYFPTIANLLSTGKKEEARQMLSQSLRLVSFVITVAVLIGVVWRHEIVTLLFSDKYAGIELAFALLMISFHMIFIQNVMGYTLTAAGHPRRSLAENTFRTALNIIGDILLIPVFGVMGAVSALLGAAYAANPLAVRLLRKSGMPVEVGPYVKQNLLLLVCAALAVLNPAASLVYKLVVMLFFVGANIALATVSRDDVKDLKGLIPENLMSPFRTVKES